MYLEADLPTFSSLQTSRTVYLLPDSPAVTATPPATQARLPVPSSFGKFAFGLSPFAGPSLTAGRVVYLLPDTGTTRVQLLNLLSWGPTGPMDNDPFTFDTTRWLAVVTGDTIVQASVTVTNQDLSAQSSVTVSAFTLQSPLATAWLTGGTPGVTYLVTLNLLTQAGRVDHKSALLPVVASRS